MWWSAHWQYGEWDCFHTLGCLVCHKRQGDGGLVLPDGCHRVGLDGYLRRLTRKGTTTFGALVATSASLEVGAPFRFHGHPFDPRFIHAACKGMTGEVAWGFSWEDDCRVLRLDALRYRARIAAIQASKGAAR